jgi:hypothetical protein
MVKQTFLDNEIFSLLYAGYYEKYIGSSKNECSIA